MLWTVRIRMADFEDTFKVEAERDYSARKQALEAFLIKYSIPGTSTQYLTTRRHQVDISVECDKDNRRGERPKGYLSFYTDQIDRIRTSISSGDFSEDVKTASIKKLLEVEELIVG